MMKGNRKRLGVLLLVSALITGFVGFHQMEEPQKPLKVAIAGLTHTHVHWVLGRPDLGDIEIVGISESNKQLAERYSKQHGFDMSLVYGSLDKMIEQTSPEAVLAFNPIDEHVEVVRICAPKGIHVMVEKPLAATLDQALEMASLAEEHNIQLLTNYETTWYASNHRAFEMVIEEGLVGRIRKIVIHDGHRGPFEIGVNNEFLDWLTDPVKNGGGAITDFGCYGASLSTWMMQGQMPISVIAVTSQFKPDIYPRVDDEASIILEYPGSHSIIQASWNWPFSRKDMQIYGETGYVLAETGNKLRYRLEEDVVEAQITLSAREYPESDPFAYLTAVLNEEIYVNANDPSALENNLKVMKILDAAKKSAKTGQRVFFR